jgi:hypothetical protein
VRADVWLPDACYQFIAENERINWSKLWPPHWSPGYPIDGTSVRFMDAESRENSAPDLQQWARQWEELDEPIPNPVGEVPIVPLVNRASTMGHLGESELDDVYLTQDRINEMLFNRALAAWTSAYRQKWATGLEIPVGEDGEPVEQFQAAIDRFWNSEDPNTKFGSFDATDITQFIKAIEEDVKHLAVQTRTPRHYLIEQGQTPSGDSIKSAESGLVAKVLDRQLYFGRSFAEVVRLSRLFDGDNPEPVEVIWADPEFRTLGELTDSVIKQHAAGLLPQRGAREKMGYSPTEIDRFEAMDAGEALVREAQEAVEPEEPAEEVAEELQVPAGAGLNGG